MSPYTPLPSEYFCARCGEQLTGDESGLFCEPCETETHTDPDEAPRHRDEGITGLYWDNLGHGGGAS